MISPIRFILQKNTVNYSRLSRRFVPHSYLILKRLIVALKVSIFNHSQIVADFFLLKLVYLKVINVEIYGPSKFLKELSRCNKGKFSNPYTFAT